MKKYHKYNLNQNDEEITAFQLAKLPIYLQKKIDSYSSLNKKQQRIDGLSLLEKAIIDFELDPLIYNLNQLKYTEKGKPFFDDKVSFSLGYTDGCTVLVLSKESKVGVDIEKIKPIVIKDYKDYFSAKEWEAILNAADQELQFYRLWTRKEALAKAIGLGMFMGFEELAVLKNNLIFLGQKWVIETEVLDGDYVLSVVKTI